jgi:glycosyltransferase involved in cell wall biosynthesis
MKGRLRISVIIPVFNAAWSLREAVGSVALRTSTHTRYESEIIVVDDASSDASWQVIEKLEREGLIQHKSKFSENRGPAAARNEALRCATGDFVTFLDADDVRVEQSLVRQADYLSMRSEADAVVGRMQLQVLQDGTFVDFGRPALILSLESGLFRRELFSPQRCGLFDENYRQGEDVDWFLRAREKGVHFVLKNEVACLYRRHGTNLTTDRTASQPFFFSALRESLRRRRANGRPAAPLPSWGGHANQ